MNKYKELLEKNSQWVAVGIGGLWLLYMIYAHVLASSTASVDVKGAPDKLGPGSVDEYVKVNTIDKLKEAMVKNEPWKPQVIDFPNVISNTLFIKNEQAAAIASRTFNTVLMGPGTTPLPPVQPTGGNLIVALPVVPPAVNSSAEPGKSIVTVPPQPGAANAQPIQQRQLWVTVFGSVPMKDLEKAFAVAGVNTLNVPAAQQTVFLHIEIHREELLSNGQFGNPVDMISTPINLATPAANPPLFPPLPPNQIGPQLTFRNLAAAQQQLICQPDFFVVTKGEIWHLPGQPGGQAGAPVVLPPPPEPKGPTPRQPPRTGGTRRPNGLIETGATNPLNKPAAHTPFLQVMSERPVGAPAFPQPGGPAAPVPPANAPGAVPTAPFTPSNLNDVNIWAHDLTVLPGKTYQYKIRYTISNPVFTFKNLCPPGKQAWAAQFELTSDWSAATPAISVPDTTNIFLANAVPNKGDAIFDIFVWGIGGVVKTTVRCTPGDLIDENLKLSLLDVRVSGGDSIVLLVDDNGTIYRRSQREDNANAAYRQLKMEAANPPPIAAQ